MNNLDQLILSNLNAERVPITQAQFSEYKKQVDFVFNLLSQQIMAAQHAPENKVKHV